LKGDKDFTFVEGWILSANRILNSSSIIVKTKKNLILVDGSLKKTDIINIPDTTYCSNHSIFSIQKDS